MLRLSSYPPELLRLGRWEALLELRLCPVVWRILLEEYEESLVIYQVGAGKPASTPPPEPIKAEALGGEPRPHLPRIEGGKKSLWAISLPLSWITDRHLLRLLWLHRHGVNRLWTHATLPPSFTSTPRGDQEKGIAALRVHL